MELYAGALGIDLMALSCWNEWLDWSNQPLQSKIRDVAIIVLACGLNVASLLCLLGVLDLAD